MTHCANRKTGSALVESCLVIAILCLILFGILQVSYTIAARNVINYSTVATARAASVGLNEFMLYKVSRYAAIPAAGPIRSPTGFVRNRPEGDSVGAQWDDALSGDDEPRVSLGQYERSVKEAYHRAGVGAHQRILDYDNWRRPTSDLHGSAIYDYDDEDLIAVQLRQDVPMTMPFAKAFFGLFTDTVLAQRDGRISRYPAARLESESIIENHAALYLQDAGEDEIDF